MPQKACGGCGKPYEAKRPTSKYCSDLCRVRANRKNGPAKGKPEPEADSGASELVAATRTELDGLGIAESRLGQQILALAERLGNTYDTGSSAAGVSKELDRLFDKAYSLAGVKGDDVDEMTERRNAKRSQAAG